MSSGPGALRLLGWLAFSSVTALTGCAEDEDTLEIDVVLRRDHTPLGDEEVVVVYPRFSGRACPCMSVSATPQGCSEISDLGQPCECAATCFESARVERAGQVLGSAGRGIEYGPASIRVSEPIEAGDELVIRGCGAERRVPLEPNDLDPLRAGTIVQRGHEFGVSWEPDPDAAYSTVIFSVGVDASSCATAETEHWFDRETTGPSQERAWDARLTLGQIELHPTIVASGATVRRFQGETTWTSFTLPRFAGSGRYELVVAPDAFEIDWGTRGGQSSRLGSRSSTTEGCPSRSRRENSVSRRGRAWLAPRTVGSRSSSPCSRSSRSSATLSEGPGSGC
jgi:hypothetical protein